MIRTLKFSRANKYDNRLRGKVGRSKQVYCVRGFRDVFPQFRPWHTRAVITVSDVLKKPDPDALIVVEDTSCDDLFPHAVFKIIHNLECGDNSPWGTCVDEWIEEWFGSD